MPNGVAVHRLELFYYMTTQENHRLTITIRRQIYGHATDVEIRPLNEESVFQVVAGFYWRAKRSNP